MGVPKDKILHTAQSLFHDHVPGKKIGLTTMWINRRAGKSGGGATMPVGAVKPDGEVPSMAALVETAPARDRRLAASQNFGSKRSSSSTR